MGEYVCMTMYMSSVFHVICVHGAWCMVRARARARVMCAMCAMCALHMVYNYGTKIC